jgi:hypothetical protein
LTRSQPTTRAQVPLAVTSSTWSGRLRLSEAASVVATAQRGPFGRVRESRARTPIFGVARRPARMSGSGQTPRSDRCELTIGDEPEPATAGAPE